MSVQPSWNQSQPFLGNLSPLATSITLADSITILPACHSALAKDLQDSGNSLHSYNSALTVCLKYVNFIYMLYLNCVFHRISLPPFVVIITSFGLTLIN